MKITKEQVKGLFESKFIKVFDLQYAQGKHYYDATRRSLEDIVAIKSKEQVQKMLPDAVTCIVILKIKDDEPKLLLSKEYRYPVGQYLLSPPAGLIDPEDKDGQQPLIITAIREIEEETGLVVKQTDKIFVVNPILFSTPGMTDESNGLVCAILSVDGLDDLKQSGAVGSELFDGFVLVNQKEAKEFLLRGKGEDGIPYSVYTWANLMYFVSDMWSNC